MKANRGASGNGNSFNGGTNTQKRSNLRSNYRGNNGRNSTGNGKNDVISPANGKNDPKISAVEKNLVSLFNLNDQQINQHMKDRFNFLLINAIGSKAIATVSSGSRFKGIVTAVDNTTLSVVLTNPELFESVLGEDSGNEELPKELIIESKDLMDLELLSVDFSTTLSKKSQSLAPIGHTNAKIGFKTDTDISGNLQVKERDLQRWTPEGAESNTTALLSGGLEDDIDHNGSWDQFAVNEKKFGVQSTWDENLYTTRLNKDSPDYQAKLKEADRIAKEIENQGFNGNIHLAEERGIFVDDSGMDEEDKYSGVDRSGADKRGNELMAALRSGVSSGSTMEITKNNYLPSAVNGKYIPPKQRNEVHNLDPAIISSMKQSGASPSPVSASSSKKSAQVISPPQVKHHHGHQSHLHHSHQESKLAGLKSKTSNEDNRLNAQREINSLKEFSQNFKIPQKFPKDLLPILSKDKQKQQEIIKRANANASESPSKEAQSSRENTTASSKATVSKDKPTGLPKASTSSPAVKPSGSTSLTGSISPADKAGLPPKPPASRSSNHSSTVNSPKSAAATVSSAAPNVASPLAAQTSAVPPKKKMDPRAQSFKLNPTARSFTPANGSPMKNFSKINNSPSRQNVHMEESYMNPQHNHQHHNHHNQTHSPRPSKRNYSPQVFSVKIPRVGERRTLNDGDFNFILQSSDVIEKAYQTQPTWGATTTESHKKLYPSEMPQHFAGGNGLRGPGINMSIPRNAMGNGMMGGMGNGMGGYGFYNGGGAPMIAGGQFMNPMAGSPFNLSAGGFVSSMPNPMMNQMPGADPAFFAQMNPVMGAGNMGFPYGAGAGVPPQFMAAAQGRHMGMMPGQPGPVDPMSMLYPQFQNGGGRGPNIGRHAGGGGPNMSPQINYGNF
ncbi:Pbp1 protein [Saccharomycopsis crataegensis]|uniref:Pbp1 protein n=1 Tax=Saccharomycopsis crataegensis TaxID=43959 RepID=A0AAV5QI77_9ASCO|nr:Pbp1 protein [Saccharomycopsis crataegensis]